MSAPAQLDMSTFKPLAGTAPPVPQAQLDMSTFKPLGAPSNAAADPLTANPNGEGVYQMKGPSGVIAVPYSNVGKAYASGHDFADGYSGTQQRQFNRDAEADPRKTYQYGLPSRGAHPMDSEIPGVDPETGGNYLKGAVKTAVQVPNTVAGWLDKVVAKASGGDKTSGQTLSDVVAGKPGTPAKGPIQTRLEKVENAIAPGVTNDPNNFDQKAGGFAEQMGEWLYGEGEARAGYEALSQSQKLEKVAKAAKFIEEHPVVAATLRTAATAGGAGAQTALHGGTPEQVGESALAGGALTGAGEAVTGAVGALRKSAVTAAATTAAHEAAPGILAERTAAEGATRQATAQQAVKDTVGKATNDSLARFNTAMKAVPGFEEVAPATGLKTFGDGAQAVREAARPVYTRLNAVTATDGKLDELMAQHADALKNFDYKAADDAETGIDALLENRPADVSPEEMKAAKLAWRDSKMLDKMHAATEQSFNGISEEMAGQPGTGDRLLKSGNKEGGSLQINLGRVLNTPAKAKEAYRVLGQDGVANLYQASHLVSNPEMAKATARLAEEVAAQFPAPAEGSNLHKVVGGGAGAAIATGIGHAVGVPAAVSAPLGAAGGAALSDGARDVMRKMVMSPRVGQLMDYAVRNNVSPKLAAGLIAAEIRKQDGETQ